MSTRYNELSNQGASHTHHETVKWLSKKTCLKCNERGGVLVCSNAGCSIVVHRRCLSCTAYFDDRGNFYCPYCAYKQALGECRKARECAILAKKTLTAFLDIKSVRSTGDEPTVECSEREKPKGTASTFQNDNLRSGLTMNVEVPKKADENRKSHSGRDGGTAIGDTVTPAKLKFSKLEKFKTKRHETAIPLEANCNRGIQRKRTQGEPHGMIEKDEGSEQLTVNSEDDDPSSEVPKDRCDNAKTLIRSPKNAACHTRKHDASVMPKESGVISRNDKETKDTEDFSYEKTEEKEQQVETSMYLTREDDSAVINDASVKGDVNEFRATVNSEDTVFGEHQQNKDAIDVNDGGLANREHKQTEAREPTKESVEKANYGVHEDENLPRNHEGVNKNNTDQNPNIGNFDFKEEDERGKWVKLRNSDVIFTSKENTGLPYEDESKSSQESHHTGYGLRSKRKSKSSASFSDCDFDECEEVIHVKLRQKVDSSKQVQHTPISVGRRKKLPWTKEEEETLKEAVDKFSLSTKKNMPWLKILEFGSHIFDGTRTPDDLKDKWRRILCKAHENA